jgi:hypothetical protein
MTTIACGGPTGQEIIYDQTEEGGTPSEEGGEGGGIAGVVSELPDGTRQHVKLGGSEADVRELFGQLSQGGEVVDSGYPGRQVRLPDGTLVGLRESSRSGGPAIDIRLPGGQSIKIHTGGL